ncbi:MAG TPA: alcohol dehydrogenase catalytic domain-containing protein [Acidimicrobiia bacterium]|nr:alcohol dehydrogenase catalytic domain-containing protein [Acidimicrobiia bacterium]
MKAIVYHGPGDVRLEERPEPEPGPGQIRVRVATAGICGTDVGEFVHQPHFFPIEGQHPHSGHLGPTVPGHEFSGWVVATGPEVSGFEQGDLVAVGAGVSCGACAPCLAGTTNLCIYYWTVGLHGDGGLAELAVVPVSSALNLAGSPITPDLAALAQPMSIAVHAIRRGRVTEGERVVVIGVGGIGTFIVRAAASAGAAATAVDIDPRRLEVAGRLGASTTLDVSSGGIDEIDGEPPDVVFECTGRPESLIRAVSLVADHGRLVVVGHQPEPVAVDFRQVALDELELIGTQAHVFATDLPIAVDLLAADPGVWAIVAPNVYPLDQVVETGLIPLARGDAGQIKLLFDPALQSPRPFDTGV